MKTAQKKVVYFVRHGQSEGNVSAVFQGPNSRLTETGLDQAARLSARIAKVSFDAIIASPYVRAKQTALTIGASVNKDIEFSTLFVERSEPTSVREKAISDPEAGLVWAQWEESLYMPGLRIEDGENYDDLIARADNALSYLSAREEETLVVVTHGFFLRTIISRVMFGNSLTPELFKQFQQKALMDNTGVSVLILEGQWQLWSYNDLAHLY